MEQNKNLSTIPIETCKRENTMSYQPSTSPDSTHVKIIQDYKDAKCRVIDLNSLQRIKLMPTIKQQTNLVACIFKLQIDVLARQRRWHLS